MNILENCGIPEKKMEFAKRKLKRQNLKGKLEKGKFIGAEQKLNEDA